MADLQHDYSTWAARKAGKGTQPEGAQPQGDMPAGESSSEQQTEGEPPPPPQECVSQAAQEVTEAIDMLEKAKGQVEEPDDIQAAIDALTEQQQALTEKAKELEESAAEEEDDEDDGEETPEPAAV
jgi:hypothetical protein